MDTFSYLETHDLFPCPHAPSLEKEKEREREIDVTRCNEMTNSRREKAGEHRSGGPVAQKGRKGENK